MAADDVAEIIGYVDPWIVSPGQTADVKVSSTSPYYTYRLVRLIQGYEGDHAPPYEIEPITTVPAGEIHTGRHQVCTPGSYAVVENVWPVDEREGVRVEFYVQPWLPETGHLQALVSTLDVERGCGYAVVLAVGGEVEVWVGTGEGVEVVKTGFAMRRWRWHHVTVEISGKDVSVQVVQTNRLAEKAAPPSRTSHTTARPVKIEGGHLLLAASTFSAVDAPAARPTSFFNGRLDSPRFTAFTPTASRLLAAYDFAQGIPTDTILDVSGAAHHGRLVSAPTRAVKGWDWDGREPDWTKASRGYGAIHFHEDDLDDADWATDFTLTIPPDASAYAVHVQTAGETAQDMVTFFVQPTPATTAAVGARVGFVLSTFTYMAYANERMYNRDKPFIARQGVRRDADFARLARRTDLGISLYDKHRDGSGAVFSSSKRPLLNVRPGYVHWAFHRPREFSADLLMVGFLEREGIPYDVSLDHDLHTEGVRAIAAYDVVITGCHPEYPTLESLDAYGAYAKRGGNIMYLGGNGFYWCSVTDPLRSHRMEVRRGDQGCRAFGLPAGERIHSLNGTTGGLWRSRGRAPNYLFGIGSDACGSGPGVPFARTPASHAPEWSWVFAGLARDELIGEHGFGGGASGDELDRLDFELGSPWNTVVLATSTGHGDDFALFNEERMFPMVDTLGSQTEMVRSDMTCYETSGGGMVFSVGSINWYSSLGWDAYGNNVARVTGNVVREFLRRGKGGGGNG